MIRLFKKKKTPAPAPEPDEFKTPCEMFGHLWQDFPWIMEDSYDRNRTYESHIEIIEPYVCRICHEIKNVKIGSFYESCKRTEHDEKKKRISEEYANYLKPVPIVNDMIQDAILVDREKLQIWNNLKNKGE